MEMRMGMGMGECRHHELVQLRRGADLHLRHPTIRLRARVYEGRLIRERLIHLDHLACRA